MTDTHSLTIENGIKKFRSPSYSYNFRLSDGYFERWGATVEDDPSMSLVSPEIMDIEISDGESCPMTCPWCYKGNKKGDASKSTHMSLATFSQILSTLPKIDGHYFLTQIAFGITSIGAHPEIFDIFQHCRDNNIAPNVTINGMDPLTDEQVEKLVRLTGAMAISINKLNFEQGLNLIDRLVKAGANQMNIHYVVSKQTISFAYDLMKAIKNDPRLSGLNAIVFLGLKPKNRGQVFDVLPVDDYIQLVNVCLKENIRFGFDSCSAPRFDKAVEISSLEDFQKKLLLSCSERCESGMFSAYVDSGGTYWQCSFGEGMPISYGKDLKNVKNFYQEVWSTDEMNKWRNRLLELSRECPLYKEIHVNPEAATGEFPEKI
jgi:sulfatase maturation enzyme AslB (radical SAM superfamily)